MAPRGSRGNIFGRISSRRLARFREAARPETSTSSCDKGFRDAIKRGTLIGFPVVGVRAVINDGASPAVDSSEMAFKTAALMGFREAYAKSAPTILEPIPGEFLVHGSCYARATDVRQSFVKVQIGEQEKVLAYDSQGKTNLKIVILFKC